MGNNRSLCEETKENLINQEILDRYLYLHYNIDFVENVITEDGKSIININTPSKIFSLQFKKEIGQGSFGKVYELEDKENEVKLAVKFASDDRETQIAEVLNLSDCKTLKVKAIGKPIINPLNENRVEEFGYFMELADGTLTQYIYRKIRTKNGFLSDEIINIAEIIRKQMVCIYRLDDHYVYTDIKMENILYKCQGGQDIFMLGDIGSAIPNDRGNYISTFPPIDIKRGAFRLDTNEEKESTMAWQLGILILTFFIGNTEQYRNLGHDRIRFVGKDDLEKINKLFYSKFGEISTLLERNPKKRRSIFEPLVL
jgi:serine/threonine protein kinase